MQFFSHLLVFATLFVHCLTENTDIDKMTHFASECGGKEKASALLDVSKEFINKAKDMFPNCAVDELNCGQKEKALAFLDFSINLITEVKKKFPTCPDTECPKPVERPVDCSEILRSGKKNSGVYTIWPRGISTNKSLTVYCDMDTDGGGWTVIQRRGKFSTPEDYFYKDWESYKNGFGNVSEEFWIGNDNIHAITNQSSEYKPYKIRFDLKDATGKTGYAEYNSFWLDDEAASYTLHIEGYIGDVGDSMTYHDKRKFSTKDRRNDIWTKSCAVEYRGAWWYGGCGYSSLNGLYKPGIESPQVIHWHSWTKSRRIGLAGVEMKLRP